MAASYIESLSAPAPFAAAEAVLSETEAGLSTGPLMQARHDEVERYAVEQGRRIVHALLQAHMTLRGQAEAVEPVVGVDGQQRTHARPEAPRHLMTTVGKVEVTRTAYSGRGLGALHPTDAELNLPLTSYSFEVERKVSRMAAEQPFDGAGKLFTEFTGVSIGLRQIEEITHRAAQDMEAFYEAASRAVEQAKTSDILVLSVDQKGIVMRREDLRAQTRRKAEQSEPKLESRLTTGEKPNRKRMATVAAVYTVAPHVRTAQEVVAGLRHLRLTADERAQWRRPPRPEHKRVWASVIEDLSSVVSQLFDEAERRDAKHKKRWFVVIDGDNKLRKAIQREAQRRGVKVTLVLDFIHALEYLWKAGSALCAQGSKELEEWVLERLTALLEGKASDVAAGMRRSATKRGLSAKQRQPIDRAASYFLKRKAMMRYDELLALGTPIASGVIEGTCRSLINDRLDVTGARWSLTGAEAVLRLRAILRSGDWDEYWTFHTRAEYRRNHESQYADEKVPSVKIPKRRQHLRAVK
jgi:hypothetical protein